MELSHLLVVNEDAITRSALEDAILAHQNVRENRIIVSVKLAETALDALAHVAHLRMSGQYFHGAFVALPSESSVPDTQTASLCKAVTKGSNSWVQIVHTTLKMTDPSRKHIRFCSDRFAHLRNEVGSLTEAERIVDESVLGFEKNAAHVLLRRVVVQSIINRVNLLVSPALPFSPGFYSSPAAYIHSVFLPELDAASFMSELLDDIATHWGSLPPSLQEHIRAHFDRPS